jgi:serine/threonine-protein kinase HipA
VTSATGKRLALFINGRPAGSVHQEDGRLTLTYHQEWRDAPGATPMSLSMPLIGRTYDDPVVRAVLWGLLPDNEQVLDRWARTFHVSSRNPFALLRYVGEDCAGAAQFVPPERLDALLAGDGGVKWIEEGEVAHRLRAMRTDPTAWHAAAGGQFSLAGAQAKTALHYDRSTRRWGDPWGVVPTTHILKPAVAGLADHDVNEHLCLVTAGLLGLTSAQSEVRTFDDERAIVVERYDRTRTEKGAIQRVHQEDVCQSLGVLPTVKYQSEGGPTPEQIIELLRQESRPGRIAAREVERFVDALVFNWLIGGTDAHAKNYSVLLSGDQIRLAPLYDVASSLPYDDIYLPKLRMAMRVGSEYRLTAISGRHWRRFAESNALDPDAVVARIADLAARTPDALATAAKAEPVRSLNSNLPVRLVDQVTAHVSRCQVALTR